MYKEYRDTTLCGAVSQMYMEMAGRHSANKESIQIIRTSIIKDSELKRNSIAQFAKNHKFPKTVNLKRPPTKSLGSTFKAVRPTLCWAIGWGGSAAFAKNLGRLGQFGYVLACDAQKLLGNRSAQPFTYFQTTRCLRVSLFAKRSSFANSLSCFILYSFSLLTNYLTSNTSNLLTLLLILLSEL